MGNILIFAVIASVGLGVFYLLSRKKLTDHQRLLLRLQDPGLNFDTLIAELRYAKMLNISLEQRLEIFEQALEILTNHPQDQRCRNFALDFGQWYCAVCRDDGSQSTEKDVQQLQREILARYQEFFVSVGG